MKILEWSDLTLTPANSLKNKPICQSSSGVVDSQDRILITGPNGCGKSTLMKSWLGLLPPSWVEGRVIWQDPVSRISYIPQGSEIDRSIPLSVKEFCQVSVNLKSMWSWPLTVKKFEKEIQELSQLLNIEDLIDKKISDLSQGQWQKTLILRGLMGNPNFILLDEPLNALDDSSKKHVLDVLFKQKSFGFAMILHEELKNNYPWTHHISFDSGHGHFHFKPWDSARDLQ